METMEHKRKNKIDKSWFNQKLVIGSYPFIVTFSFEKGYDIIINVSDEYYDDIDDKLINKFDVKKTHWFPMNEINYDIGLNSIYGALVVLFNAEKNNKTVYLHCHAGKNRSQIVKAAFYFMMYEEHYVGGDDKHINRLVRATNSGYLPPIEKLEKFLIELRKQLINFNGKPLGGLIDEIRKKINTL